MPQNIKFVDYDNKIIVVAPAYANWIVLESPIQLEVFKCLKQGKTIKETLNLYGDNQNDVKHVVTQIEARKFCTKKVHSSADEKRSMHLYLTNKCNLRCPHCYMFSGNPIQGEITTDEVLKLVKDYRIIAKGETITISGGEPTVRPDFTLIVKTAKELGLQVSVLSNGTLFKDDEVQELANYIDSLQISIDGFSEKSNSKIRGKGNFEKSLRAIDSFVRSGVRTSVSITPSPERLKESWMEYVNFAKNLTELYHNYEFEVRFADELLQGRQINLTEEEKREYFNTINKILKEIYGPDYDLMFFVRDLYYGAILDNCMYGIFTVKSNGDVFFCARIGDLNPIANIRTTSMSRISELSSAAEKISRITNLSPCNECELRYICGDGCRIEKFPSLVKVTSFDDINHKKFKRVPCNDDTKRHFFDLMIRSNKYFYQELY